MQEKIPHVLQGQIELELRKIPYSDLCESLDRLDVAISFLKSVGTEKPQTLLYNFMTKVLKMEKSFPSQKVRDPFYLFEMLFSVNMHVLMKIV